MSIDLCFLHRNRAFVVFVGRLHIHVAEILWRYFLRHFHIVAITIRKVGIGLGYSHKLYSLKHNGRRRTIDLLGEYASFGAIVVVGCQFTVRIRVLRLYFGEHPMYFLW